MSECNPGERLKWTVLWIAADWKLGVRAEEAFDTPSLTEGEVADLFREIINHGHTPPAEAVPRLAEWMADTLVATAGLDGDQRQMAAQTFQTGLAQATSQVVTHL